MSEKHIHDQNASATQAKISGKSRKPKKKF